MPVWDQTADPTGDGMAAAVVRRVHKERLAEREEIRARLEQERKDQHK